MAFDSIWFEARSGPSSSIGMRMGQGNLVLPRLSWRIIGSIIAAIQQALLIFSSLLFSDVVIGGWVWRLLNKSKGYRVRIGSEEFDGTWAAPAYTVSGRNKSFTFPVLSAKASIFTPALSRRVRCRFASGTGSL